MPFRPNSRYKTKYLEFEGGSMDFTSTARAKLEDAISSVASDVNLIAVVPNVVNGWTTGYTLVFDEGANTARPN